MSQIPLWYSVRNFRTFNGKCPGDEEVVYKHNFLRYLFCLQVKTQLHHRLQELQPLPEMLKSTELKLHDTEDRLMAAERKNGDSTKLIAELSAKVCKNISIFR